MKHPCKRCGRIDRDTFVEGELCNVCYWINKYNELEKQRDNYYFALEKIAESKSIDTAIECRAIARWALDKAKEGF